MLFPRALPVPALLCSLLLTAPALARADAAADARKAIQAQYNKSNAALMKKDLKGATGTMAADYEIVTMQGQKLTKQQIMGQIQANITLVKSLRAKTTIQKITLKGGQAIVKAKGRVELNAFDPQNQQPVMVVSETISEDTWVKKGKSWMQKRAKILSQKFADAPMQ